MTQLSQVSLDLKKFGANAEVNKYTKSRGYRQISTGNRQVVLLNEAGHVAN
jgi:hypothetical protein